MFTLERLGPGFDTIDFSDRRSGPAILSLAILSAVRKRFSSARSGSSLVLALERGPPVHGLRPLCVPPERVYARGTSRARGRRISGIADYLRYSYAY